MESNLGVCLSKEMLSIMNWHFNIDNSYDTPIEILSHFYGLHFKWKCVDSKLLMMDTKIHF